MEVWSRVLCHGLLARAIIGPVVVDDDDSRNCVVVVVVPVRGRV